MAEVHEISLAAEPALEIGGFTVTNTVTATLFVTLVIIVLAYLVRRKAGVVPSRLQMLFEVFFGFFLEQLTIALGSEARARKLLPLIVTLFFFILISNLFILIPLVGSVVTGEEHFFFRTPTTDYSATIAMAVLVIVLSHIIAFSISPMRHLGNFIKIGPLLKVRKLKDLPLAIIDFFLGLLEIVSELAKIVSLATRLFGNIFSGEVVIVIVVGLAFFTQYLIPIPFIVLASFAGIVQAFVFTLLSLLFMSSTIRHVTAHH